MICEGCANLKFGGGWEDRTIGGVIGISWLGGEGYESVDEAVEDNGDGDKRMEDVRPWGCNPPGE